MTKEDLQKIAVAAALNAGIDPALVCAVCATESSWNPDATRYEPAFYKRYIESMTGLSMTEKTDRATSFGLMQIMGQVAREQGFDEPDLRAGLLNPLNAVTQGCRKLKKCLSLETHEHGTYAEDVNAGLLRYNGGGDANYPALVMSHYNDYAYLNSIPDREKPEESA